MWEQGGYGQSLHLPFNYVENLNCSKNKILINYTGKLGTFLKMTYQCLNAEDWSLKTDVPSITPSRGSSQMPTQM